MSLNSVVSTYLSQRANLDDCHAQIADLLFSDLKLTGGEFVGHLDMSYFKNISDRAEGIFIAEYRKSQRDARTEQQVRSAGQ